MTNWNAMLYIFDEINEIKKKIILFYMFIN